MRTGVGAGLVEADPTDIAEGVGLELDANLDRCRVTRIFNHWGGTGSPDRAGAVHVDRRPRRRLFPVAAVVDGPGLDHRRGTPMSDPRIAPGYRGVRRGHRRGRP